MLEISQNNEHMTIVFISSNVTNNSYKDVNTLFYQIRLQTTEISMLKGAFQYRNHSRWKSNLIK